MGLRSRGGTERGWTIEKTIVGPPPPAEAPRPVTVAPARPPVVEPPRLTGLLPIRPMPTRVDASAKGIVPPPIVPGPPSYRSPRSTTSSKAVAAAARKPAALIVDDSGGMAAPTERPPLEPTEGPAPSVAPGRDGFPRSAAERAGASAALRPSPLRRPSRSHLAAVPSRAGSPQLAQSMPEIEPVALAQGSVTTPLPAPAPPMAATLSPVLLPPALDPTPLPLPLELTPAPSARRRPPTVEFPTLDSSDLSGGHAGPTSDQTFRDLPVASPLPDPTPLPSIYSVIDRRAQPAAAPPASSSSSGAFARLSTLDAQAVPEPIPPEVAPVSPEPLDPPPHRERAAPFRAQPPPRRAPAASLVPAVARVPVEHPAAGRRGRSARSRSAPRPVASFSAAEAAFFDEGEQLAAAEWESALDEDRPDQYRIKRRGLWRRLTGRR